MGPWRTFLIWHNKISKLRISLEKRIKNHRRRNPKSTRDRSADHEFPLRSRFMKLHLSTTRWRDEADARGLEEEEEVQSRLFLDEKNPSIAIPNWKLIADAQSLCS